MKKITVLLLGLLFTTQANAQDKTPINNPPVNVEALVADQGIIMQTTINKQFRDTPSLGFFSVTSLISDWDTQRLTDFMNQSGITFDVFMNLKLIGGYHYTEVTGFRPSAGLQYSYANEDWLVVLYPRADLTTDSNQENYASVAYTPQINEKYSFYSRMQGLYTFALDNGEHQRSYVLARVGFTRGDYTFGIGGNLDYFGPDAERIESIGLFGSVNLF